MTTELRNALERHLRDYGLRDVVETLADICSEAAADIEVNGPVVPGESDPNAWRAAAYELKACRDAVTV